MADEQPADSATRGNMVWVGGEEEAGVFERPRPEAAQNGKSPAPESPREAQSRALAETLVSSITDRLLAEARKRGGFLTLDDLRELNQEFHKKTAALEILFQQSFDHYVLAKQRATFDHARKYPFDRVIVDTFDELFLPQRIDEDGEKAITRRVLPGIFMALDKMLGPDTMEDFQERARTIVDRIFPGNEKDFDWGVIYADSGARDLSLDALIAMAPYFEDTEKRMEWFLGIVNGALDAADDWRLTERGFYNLTDTMFARLGEALETPEDRKTLELRHGEAVCGEMMDILGKIDDAHFKLG